MREVWTCKRIEDSEEVVELLDHRYWKDRMIVKNSVKRRGPESGIFGIRMIEELQLLALPAPWHDHM
jgi:hypothetical protein